MYHRTKCWNILSYEMFTPNISLYKISVNRGKHLSKKGGCECSSCFTCYKNVSLAIRTHEVVTLR